MSVRDVYCSFARSWITQTLRFDVLKFAGTALTIEEDRTEGVPTWVPDWRALSRCYQEPCSSKSNASGEMPAKARISTDLSTMWLNGMRCDEIKSIVPNMGATGNYLQDLSDYCWSVVLNPDGVNAYSESMTRVEATFWLLFRDQDEVLRRDLDKLRRYVLIYSIILSQANGIEGLVAQLSHHESDSKIEEFCKDKAGDLICLKAILGLCMQFGESIFGDLDAVLPLLGEMTENGGVDFNTDVDGMKIFASTSLRGTDTVAFHTFKGRIGMIRHCLATNISDRVAAARTRPSNVILPGDVVCVLAGHDYPVVLRRKDSHFVLIGVCSIIGLMDGEAMELVRAGVAEGEVLEIR
ncbi:MAG: hypothetical protein M1839_004667 [Geoglossum umbratile]|nr:MAG: hypothetical protein M1839_004667 [Geoglossum umbratile]